MAAEDLDSCLQKVNALLSSGQPDPALRAAEQALEGFPDSVELLNLAGLGAAMAGDYLRAEKHWLRSVAVDPASARTLFNLGLLYDNLQRKDQAEHYYRQAIALDPGNAAAHSNLGAVLAGIRRPDEAEQHYRQALALQPGHVMAHFNLGLLLTQAGRSAEAERHFRQATALDPRNAPAWFQLGTLLAGADRDDEAEQCYRRSIELEPGHAMTYNNLGLLLAKSGRNAEAEQCYRKAISLQPGSAGAFSNLGLLLETVGRNDEAEQCYRHAIALQPEIAVAYSNLALLLLRRADRTAAEQYLRQAVAVEPNYAIARLNLGYLLLQQGNFAEGWHYHEARLDPGLPAENRHPFPIKASFPAWGGEPLQGKSLLVWPEQGMGDEIQFCRYLPLLKRQGAARITFVCKAPLKTLMEEGLEGIDVVPATAATPLTPHDYWTYPLSIPLHCHTDLATIPAQLPYLRVPPQRLVKWSPRVPRDDCLNVGLVWKGSTLHSNDRYRSLPGLETLAPLWSVPGVRFISLQKEQDEDKALHPPVGQPLLALGHEFEDFADTAAVIAWLDLVITVDTAAAHLAGALAKPCWVMLPARRCDWRWLHGRDDSPWYPGVMRLFHQAGEGDWQSVVQPVTAALRDLASPRTSN